ncbi:MAG: helix-turn-helix transcriptional regulator [Betaproteobacteria bacterium]|nr:helix-turn-helix transcriptional regulator [Betaproteobacteria bacterium]
MTDSLQALAAGFIESELPGRAPDRHWNSVAERLPAWSVGAAPALLPGLHELVALIAQPAMVIDSEARLLSGNRALARWMDGQRSMTLLNGQIRWRNTADQASFSGILHWLDKTGSDPSLPRQRRLRLNRQESPLPLIVDCCRVDPASGEAVSARVRHAVLVLNDAQAALNINPAMLVEFFGLSRAEAKVAGLLAEGESPADIAVMLGVSTNTVRTHLRTISSKLGVSRQAEIVRMLMLMPAELG